MVGIIDVQSLPGEIPVAISFFLLSFFSRTAGYVVQCRVFCRGFASEVASGGRCFLLLHYYQDALYFPLATSFFPTCLTFKFSSSCSVTDYLQVMAGVADVVPV